MYLAYLKKGYKAKQITCTAQNILVAPLELGLGHAKRCNSNYRALQANNFYAHSCIRWHPFALILV
jgi:hypothetical protein